MAGIYIHIPFCKQACTYCNFHFSTSLKNKSAFLEALLLEIEGCNIVPGEPGTIETIYIGGGTPSLLTIDELQAILNHLIKFNISKDAEITLEANPDDINPESLAAWHSVGINRLSVGIQSFNEGELQWMHRAHNSVQAIQCLKDIHASAFMNYSIDLIYGSPVLSDEQLRENISILLDYKVPHISCYALTVEPKTRLHHLIKYKKSPDVDGGNQSRQFMLIMEKLTEAGYEHYEISNFALPGKRSRHNSNYWNGRPYQGFGPSAHSFNGSDKRWWNIANNSRYISAMQNNQQAFTEEFLEVNHQWNEFIMISLRTSEGLNLGILENRFGVRMKEKLMKESEKYLIGGKLIIVNNRIILTNEGKLFADGIAADLFY